MTGRCVLLVEDDRFLQKAAETTLRRRGFVVLTASDGEEALRVAREARPDLVLLDMIMPRLQGLEVLRILKGDPATADIPVLMLSNLGQTVDQQHALDAGAAGYLVKANISLAELADRVDQALADRPAA